jgi:ubiquinone/menaquinone biosynthesis C-methylase UbiE
MLTALAHRIASHAWAYDFIQRAVGVNKVHDRMATLLNHLNPHGLLLDIGGGTGINRFLWHDRGQYICLDLDPQKLRGYRTKFPTAPAILADATLLPLADHCADFVLCKFLTHHLTDSQLDALLTNINRVLKPTGRVMIIDPIWNPSLRAGQILWRYDRGSFPRPADQLQQRIARDFTIDVRDQFAVWHEYLLLAASPITRDAFV